MASTQIGAWHPARQDAEDDWQVVRALRGGTTAMRSLGEVFLPKDAREKKRPDVYVERLKRSFLFPAYDDTVRKIAARPFQRGVTVSETGEPMLDAIVNDCDRRGTSLTRFSHRLHDIACDRGVGHFIVDMPAYQAASLADQIARNVRPYFSLVHPDNLVNWGFVDDGTGRDVLDFVCIYEQAERRPEGNPFQAIPIERIRFWSRQAWQVWERDAIDRGSQKRGFAQTSNDLIQTPQQAQQWNGSDTGEAYQMVREGINPLGVVPLVTYYTQMRQPMTGRPPLIDLGWMNVKHWQSSSQQSQIVHYVRAPMLKGRGMTHEQVEAGVTLGAGAMMLSTSPDFDISYVTVDGDSVPAGERDVQKIEDQMAALGMQPLLITVGPETATGKAIDEIRAQSEAQAWAEGLEWALYKGYELAAQWLGVALPDDFDVTVFRDFGIVLRTTTDLQMLQADATAGRITVERYLLEAKRRGLYGDDLDPQEEAGMASEATGADLRGLQPIPQPPDAEDDEDAEAAAAARPA